MHIRDEVVDKPSQRNRHQIDPVTLNYKPIRNACVAHRVLPVVRWVLHIQPPYEDSQSGKDPQPKRQSPDGAQVILAKSVGIKTEI
jgi:hypothetical protein